MVSLSSLFTVPELWISEFQGGGLELYSSEEMEVNLDCVQLRAIKGAHKTTQISC